MICRNALVTGSSFVSAHKYSQEVLIRYKIISLEEFSRQ